MVSLKFTCREMLFSLRLRQIAVDLIPTCAFNATVAATSICGNILKVSRHSFQYFQGYVLMNADYEVE